MLRVAFAGTPEFAVPALRALAGSHHQLVGVLSQPDRPAGRGRELKSSPIKQLALELGLPLAQPVRLRNEAEREPLEAWTSDVLVVVAYGLILPPPVLALPRLGCLNIHASLLPRWRGAAPIQRAILAGDTETGVTIMQLDAGLDTGATLAQRRVVLDAGSDSGQVHAILAQLGAQLLLETLDALEAGHSIATPQPQEGVTYAAKIDKAEAQIDWRQSAEQIARQVRAFNPWPVADTRWQGRQLRIWEAAALAAPTRSEFGKAPGDVLGVIDGQLQVQSGQGALSIRRLQLTGRRVVDAADFAAGATLSGAHFD
jgi:methionyl-tRNA formyltransferase